MVADGVGGGDSEDFIQAPMPPGRATKMSLWASIRSLRSLRLSHGISMSRSGKVLPPRSTSVGIHRWFCRHSPLLPCRCNPSDRSCSRRKPGRGRSLPSTFPSLLSTWRSRGRYSYLLNKNCYFHVFIFYLMMFYLLFIDVLSVIYKCFRQRYTKISRLLGSFADNFLILQTITNLINRKKDF